MRLLQHPTSDRAPGPGPGVPAGLSSAPESGPVAAAVAAARAAMAAARDGDLRRQPVEDLAVLVQALSGLEAEASALLGEVLGEAERRQVADAEAATGTDAWAAALTGQSREVLAGGARVAELLRSKYHHARAAYATGAITTRQVRIIVAAAEQAPLETTPEQLAAAEEVLVNKATGIGTRTGRPMNPKRLRQAARRMLDVIDRDLADKHEAIMLGRESRRAKHETYLALHDNGDGTYSGKFTIPELHGSLLRTAIETLSAPRRLNKARTGPEGENISGYDESAPTGPDHGLSDWEVAGNALCELIEHLPTDGWNGANALTLLVTMTAEDLTRDLAATGDLDPAAWPDWRGPDETGTAKLDTGTRVAAGDLRRLACEAGLVPAVLNSRSVPLDLGRTKRLHTHHQRKALAPVHDTCAIGTCERPFAWTEIHHLIAWSHHGDTDLDNAIPLCSWHHHRAHDPRWHLTQHPLRGWELKARRTTRG
ncbi:HNH endonuclease signature motif containing protein [Nocardioides sp. OK12]|uniref:HNH endonuclease signature motif containing protein n=1 Tax=Nocardioides sp. OK12 TaxID=2758661 RepID=UPI0021C35E06|nr:HNH endonuclease signature motif containing protein [Nocardioides sp. OK12]